jgi:hypothetical protein
VPLLKKLTASPALLRGGVMRCEMNNKKFLSKEDEKLQQKYLNKMRANQKRSIPSLIIWNDGSPLQPGAIQHSEDEAAIASYEAMSLLRKEKV